MLISHGNADGCELNFHSFQVYIKPGSYRRTVLKTIHFFDIHMTKFLCLANKSPYIHLHVCAIKIVFAYPIHHLNIKIKQKIKEKKDLQKWTLTNLEK